MTCRSLASCCLTCFLTPSSFNVLLSDVILLTFYCLMYMYSPVTFGTLMFRSLTCCSLTPCFLTSGSAGLLYDVQLPNVLLS